MCLWLLLGMSDAGVMSHRLDPGKGFDLRDQPQRSIAGASACSVGDGHKSGLERSQFSQCRKEVGRPFVSLGGKELEGETRIGGIEPVSNLHQLERYNPSLIGGDGTL